MELALGPWARTASKRHGAWNGASRQPSAGASEPRIPSYFAMAPIALCVIDRQRRFTAANDRMAELAGCPAEALAGRFAASLLADADTILSSCFAKVDAGEQLRDFVVVWRGRQLQLSFSPLVEDGRVDGLCVAAADISRRVRTERRLQRSRRRLLSIAARDHLTGLLNRRGLEMRLHRELRRAGTKRASVAVLLVDNRILGQRLDRIALSDRNKMGATVDAIDDQIVTIGEFVGEPARHSASDDWRRPPPSNSL